MKKTISILVAGCLLSGSLFPALGRTARDTGTESVRQDTAERPRMAYRGFIGGMMLHTGYVCSRDVTIVSPQSAGQTVSIGGAPFGIGGAIRFMFGKHLRVGAEGYVSTLTYGEHHSHARTGWGGILADSAWKVGKCRLFIGGTVGGGSQTNTTILSPVRDDYMTEESISYRKYGFIAVAPFAVLNVSNPQDDFVTGPRLYVGFMFGHAD